jgi:hypothetical protein
MGAQASCLPAALETTCDSIQVLRNSKETTWDSFSPLAKLLPERGELSWSYLYKHLALLGRSSLSDTLQFVDVVGSHK